jgi:RNA polymerase sigma-70 factor (ECF subfamily)
MALNHNHLNRRFEDLTIGYVEPLYRLAYARVGNIQDAEDIVQETYLRAYRSFENFRDGTSMKNWLAKILINIVRDQYRKNSRHPATVELNESLGEDFEEPVFSSPEDQLVKDEIDPELSQALRSMSEALATPLIMREIYDASYEEIASALDLPIGTVMSRLSRARTALRKKLLGSSEQPMHQRGSGV